MPRDLEAAIEVPSAISAYVKEAFKRSEITIVSGELLAKVLTGNDDSGRHGILIPVEAYSFFPDLPVPDARANATVEFASLDVDGGRTRTLAWKYYQRYPERRVTRVNSGVNAGTDRTRIAVFIRACNAKGGVSYAFDYSVDGLDPRFPALAAMLFVAGVPRTPGTFVRLPIDVPRFEIDADLGELLARYDDVNSRGWIRTLRQGNTGVGYTFETLIGIHENNDRHADFLGIEVKCKLAGGEGATSGKTNLFQQGPVWSQHQSAIDRLKRIGRQREDGTYACYSQVTTSRNNLGLLLKAAGESAKIELLKDADAIGHWPCSLLRKRLEEKHWRAVFVKATARGDAEQMEYRYCELVYCERPSIDRFIELVGSRNIVFEFLMREGPASSVRNHGYPWRLTNQSLLDQLFRVQIKLRG